MENLTFICGNQRSGTTWLANIFDSSRNTLTFMEPFAPQANLFPNFPHEFIYVSPSSQFLIKTIQQGISELPLHKSRLFGGNPPNRSIFRVESMAMKSIYKFNRVLQTSWLAFAGDYLLLNLNRVDHPELYFSKSVQQPHTWIIKELRVSNKIELISQALPQTKFIHIVRHPIATIHSMLSWMKRGNLSELKQNMNYFLEYIEGQKVFHLYSDKIAYCKNRGLESKLALYWLISNEITSEQLKKAQNGSLCIYENLAQNPLAEIKRLFEFVGIEVDAQVEHYIQQSSTQSTSKIGAVNTNRHSRSYYKDWIGKVSDSTTQEILNITANSYIFSAINEYYD